MATAGNLQELEIEELILKIRKLTREYLCMNSNTISEINSRLHSLKDFLSSGDDTQDLLSAVDDFIKNISSHTSHYFSANKLLLKNNTIRLEDEFENLKRKKTLYSYTLFSR